jgi:hypothetical protein
MLLPSVKLIDILPLFSVQELSFCQKTITQTTIYIILQFDLIYYTQTITYTPPPLKFTCFTCLDVLSVILHFNNSCSLLFIIYSLPDKEYSDSATGPVNKVFYPLVHCSSRLTVLGFINISFFISYFCSNNV